MEDTCKVTQDDPPPSEKAIPDKKAKRKKTILILRIVLGIKTFILTVVSLTCLGFLVYTYLQIKDNFESPSDASTVEGSLGVPQFNESLVFIYLFIALFSITSLANIAGFLGVICDSSVKLTCYIIILLMLALALISIIVFGAVKPDWVKQAFNVFAMNYVTLFYGTIEGMSALPDLLINTAQRHGPCCGMFVPSQNNLSKDTLLYSTVLFWLESTQWGSIQIERDGKDITNSDKILVVPETCCRPDDCPKLPYGDRLKQISIVKKMREANMATRSCVDGLYEFFMEDYLGVLIGLISFMIVIMFMCMIFAGLIMCLERKKSDEESSNQEKPKTNSLKQQQPKSTKTKTAQKEHQSQTNSN